MKMGDIRRLSPPGLKDDLVPAEEEEKNWKGIIISLLVIGTICSFIMLSIIILTPRLGEPNRKEPIKLEEYLKKRYDVLHYNGTWITDDELLAREPNGSICIYNVITKHKDLIMEDSITKTYEVEKFTLSHDRRHLLLVHDIRPTGHYSHLARYTVFDKELHTTTPLRVGGTEDVNELHQHGAWVPQRNLIVLVNRNNMHLFDTRGELIRTITESGHEDGSVFNGVADMTYEEHVWHSSAGFWSIGSPGGWSLLYATIDATGVDKLAFVEYGKSGNDTPASAKTQQQSAQDKVGNMSADAHRIYPKVSHYPYPKPGRSIPRLTLRVCKFNDAGTEYVHRDALVLPPQPYDKENYLATPPTWVTPDQFIAIWTQRSQDQAILARCVEQSKRGTIEFQCTRLTEEKLLRAWSGSLVISSPPLVSASGSKIFVRLPVSDGIAGTFQHAALVTIDGKKQFLTHGQFVVTDIFGYREDMNTLFYAATSPDEPGVRHIYALKHSNNSNEEKMIDCLSCRINGSCLYNSLQFSPNGHHFVLECLGPHVPMYYLVNVNNNSQVMETLHASEQWATWVAQRMMPRERNYAILTPSGHRIRIQLTIPNFVNELDDAKYPLVLQSNRLPAMQSVDYRNRLDWSRYLTSARGYVTARVDTRGTSFQGFRHMFSVYRKLGELETEDLSFALAYLKHLPYIDVNRIAVVGNEFGAHLAVSLLAREKQITCGVAVAPIASLKNYLATFSERFMSLPTDNYLGYEHSELRLRALALKGKNLLIIHGTLNRRINLQHTMQFTKSLIDNNVQYKTQLYPDSGSFETWKPSVLLHYYRTIEEYLALCFKFDDDEDDSLVINKVNKGKNKATLLIN